jgi:uncharacterized protein
MQAGKPVWFDLTVPNTEKIRDFYAQVIGWTPQDLSMGDYNDYAMLLPGTEEGVTGICHPAGPNASIPPQWIIYIAVDDLEGRVQTCKDLGGEVLVPPGDNRYAIIKDPAGAAFALFEIPKDESTP